MNVRGKITEASIGGIQTSWAYDYYGQLTGNSAYYTQLLYYTPNSTTGNLTTRQNYLRSLSETFDYDTSDRLTSVTGPNALTLTYTDGKGNLTSKSDAGTFLYDNGKPYQLAHVTPYTANFPTGTQTATYTSFGKVNTLAEGVYSATFKYNADNERVKMVITQSGTAIKTKYYFGNSYEKVVEGSTTTEYIWIGGSPYSAVAVAKIVNGGTPQVWAIFRDHLGSITHVKNGGTVYEYSFDAFGRRRDKDTWSYTVDDTNALFADRGFTGHEHLTEFKLINMNGRLYDPLVGRFLSPDNYVQSPDFTQSFNRYGYCWNNPLRYTDPSGDNPLLIAAFVLAGMYVGGAGANSPSGSFDLLNAQWNPAKWAWTGKNAWKTYVGLGVGGAVGYLGGAMAVEYLGGEAAISLGLEWEGLAKACAVFTKEGLQYAGLATIAGGGLYFTGSALNKWWKDKDFYFDTEFRIDHGPQLQANVKVFGLNLGISGEKDTSPWAQFNGGYDGKFYSSQYSFDHPCYGYGGIIDPYRTGWSVAILGGAGQNYASHKKLFKVGRLESEYINAGIFNINKSFDSNGKVNEKKYSVDFGFDFAFWIGVSLNIQAGFK